MDTVVSTPYNLRERCAILLLDNVECIAWIRLGDSSLFQQYPGLELSKLVPKMFVCQELR